MATESGVLHLKH